MEIIIFLLLVVGITLVIFSWLKSELNCPPPKIIYRFVPKHTLDVQFGDENMPSELYQDMFNDSSPWVGGYTIGMGKTYTLNDKKK